MGAKVRVNVHVHFGVLLEVVVAFLATPTKLLTIFGTNPSPALPHVYCIRVRMCKCKLPVINYKS